jgi:hypothetical protein
VPRIHKSSEQRESNQYSVPHASSKMNFALYSVDRMASLVLLALICITYLAFAGIRIPQLIFISYSIFLHLIGASIPLRACWSLWNLEKRIRNPVYKNPYGSLSNQLIEPQAGKVPAFYPFIHVILIPNYHEDLQTLQDTLRVLASHPQAKAFYDVRCLEY